MAPINPYYRVLVTGYGKFSHYEDNPSWLAVKPLNGTILHRDPTSSPTTRNDDDLGDSARPIHITSFDIPVAYSSVLSVVPPLHERPPHLPANATESGLGVPDEGYDLILHTGVGYGGGLSLEKRGRKTGYALRDIKGDLAPVVEEEGNLEPRAQAPLVGNTIKEKARLEPQNGTQDEKDKPVKRGFAEGYEAFPEELYSTLDIDGVVRHLKGTGFEIVRSSEDAGLYLCEYINYCALAESQRSKFEAGAKPTSKKTKTLFVHVPPIGEVLSTEETTEGIKLVVQAICWGTGGGRGKK